MALIASDKGGADFIPAPAGNHPARCFALIDIGTQNDTFQGKTIRAHKAVIFWELPTELHEFSPGDGKEPFTLSKRFTLSLHKKATMRGFLEAWRGRAFSDEEAKGFDVAKLVGAPCLLSVIHKPKINDPGKMSAVVNAATPLPKGLVCPAAMLKPLVYEVSMGQNEVFRNLQPWIQKEIMKCEEFNASPASHDTSKDSPESVSDNDGSDAGADSALPF